MDMTEIGPHRGLNLRGPSLQDLLNKNSNEGSSQQNPVDLEDALAKPNAIDDTENEDSEDDRPKTPLTVPRPLTKGDKNEMPSRLQRPQSSFERFVSNRSPPLKEVIKDVVLETQNQPTVSNADATDGFDSSFDDDDEDELDSFGDESEVRSEAQSTFKPSSPRPASPEFPIVSGSAVGQSVGAIDVSCPGQSASSTNARPPSPSDAALAKKAAGPNVPSYSMDVPKPWDRVDSGYLPRIPSLDNGTAFDMPRYIEKWNPYATDNAQDGGSIKRNRKTYDHLLSEINARSDLFEASPADSLPFGLVEDCLRGLPEGLATSSGNPLLDDIESFRKSDEFLFDVGAQRHIQEPASFRGPSSRLDIANLINDSSVGNQRRPLKRKADDISSEALVPPKEPGSNDSTTFDGNDDESQLADAQIRDEPAVQATNLSSQGGMSEIAVSSITTTVSTPAAKTEEPPRKKMKSSSSSSRAGDIAKFVSGVCVGVVGVLATIVATIPASVKEEALREMATLA